VEVVNMMNKKEADIAADKAHWEQLKKQIKNGGFVRLHDLAEASGMEVTYLGELPKEVN
jgi:hypothetical protein